MKLQPAVFLDRDGVLNDLVYRPALGFHAAPDSPAVLRCHPGAGHAIRRLRTAGFRVLVVTNQPGIAKGDLTEQNVRAIHETMARALADTGDAPDGFYFCPHIPLRGLSSLPADHPIPATDCDCRKPRPGMLIQGARDHHIDLTASYMVGDNPSDVEAGRRVGCRTIQVVSLGLPSQPEVPPEAPGPDARVDSIVEAVDWILEDSGRDGS